MIYLIALDNDGVIAAKRRSGPTSLTEDEAIWFVTSVLKLGRVQIFGSLEHAPTGSKQIQVYLSKSPDGIGRVGRNWIPLAIAEGS